MENKKKSKVEIDRAREERHEKILEYLQEIHDKQGISPSFREIKDDLGISSTWVVQRDIQMLAEQGYLLYTPKKPRSIKLIEKDKNIPLIEGKEEKDLFFLTALEKNIYYYLVEFVNEHHYAASITEIAQEYKLSLNAVTDILDKFEKYELIRRDKGIHRSVMIID